MLWAWILWVGTLAGLAALRFAFAIRYPDLFLDQNELRALESDAPLENATVAGLAIRLEPCASGARA